MIILGGFLIDRPACTFFIGIRDFFELVFEVLGFEYWFSMIKVQLLSSRLSTVGFLKVVQLETLKVNKVFVWVNKNKTVHNKWIFLVYIYKVKLATFVESDPIL